MSELKKEYEKLTNELSDLRCKRVENESRRKKMLDNETYSTKEFDELVKDSKSLNSLISSIEKQVRIYERKIKREQNRIGYVPSF